MMKKKPYTGFRKEKPEDLTIVKDKFLNDFELLRLWNFLTEGEIRILTIVNLSQRLQDYHHRGNFRIRYDMMIEMTGWEKKIICRHLKGLRTKGILVMSGRTQWSYHVPTISKLLTSGTTQPNEPYPERKKYTNEQEEFDKLYDKVIFNRGSLVDPILAGLPEGWENL
jgi:hypothetical protein